MLLIEPMLFKYNLDDLINLYTINHSTLKGNYVGVFIHDIILFEIKQTNSKNILKMLYYTNYTRCFIMYLFLRLEALDILVFKFIKLELVRQSDMSKVWFTSFQIDKRALAKSNLITIFPSTIIRQRQIICVTIFAILNSKLILGTAIISIKL